MKNNLPESMDYFRGENADDLNIETREDIEVTPVERVRAKVRAKEAVQDSGDVIQDEKIELWMKNIRDFIRSIDVKAL